jgi:hypothetical protein
MEGSQGENGLKEERKDCAEIKEIERRSSGRLCESVTKKGKSLWTVACTKKCDKK